MEQTSKPDRMRTVPVGRLMLSMSVPMVLSMMLQAVYNVVDSAFVSNLQGVGELALNALTLAYPIQVLTMAVAIGTGVGCNALLSKSLGQGDREKASRVVGNGVLLSLVVYVVFALFGVFGVDAYVATQTDDPTVQSMATQYLRICCTVSIGSILFATFEKTLQGTGHSVYSTIAQVSGALTNIVLDPILIYGAFGLPEIGVKGAAVATVVGQCVSCVVAFAFHLKVDTELSNGLRYMVPSGKTIAEVYSIGLPAIAAQALVSVMTYGLNRILGSVSTELVTAYGLYYKVQLFVQFASFGLRDAVTPIVSYSHGMGDARRIDGGIKYGLLYSCIMMVAGTALIELVAVPLSGVFGLSGTTQQYCIGAMRTVSVSFLFAGANITLQGVFQALNGGVESLVVSLSRQLVFVLPVAWAFVKVIEQSHGSYSLVWWTFPIAEVVSLLIACVLLKRTYSRQVRTLKVGGSRTAEGTC